jgi:hypothetical protein
MRAGCAAAYVDRAGLPFLLGAPPDVVGRDLAEVVGRILEMDGPV